MNQLTRREFLASAATAGTLGLCGCAVGEDPYALTKPDVPGADKWYKGEEKWIPSVCGQCQAGCGIRVRVVEGRAIKIEGHTDHPINRGGLGPKGQSGLQALYNPHRIRTPLRRRGRRGGRYWDAITWEEAIGEIAKTLRELRAGGEARALAVLDGEPRGMMHELWARFLEAYGSPNHFDHHSMTDGGKILAMSYMQGVPELPAYDWERTRYVLSFGASLFESWCQTIHFMRASSYLRRGEPGQRVKLVQVSPGFSTTAAKADEWVPIEPATYGLLALGLGHVLVRDKLCDLAFLKDHTFGFEDWKDSDGKQHRGFRDLLLKDYSPEKVAPLTGVPIETIGRLAREMSEHHPAIVLDDGSAAAATNGLGTAMSIHALNALLGNLERPGGMLVQRTAPLAPWPALQPDEAARTNRATPRLDGSGSQSCPLGRGCVQSLPEALLSGKPYPAKALILYKSNPAFSKPGGQRWIEALEKVPLVVSCSPLHDESTCWADLVLPDHTYLERWEVVEPAPSVGYPGTGLRQPVVPPLYNTLATGDLVIKLAQAVGAPMDKALPWKDYREACLERLKGLLQVQGGSAAATEMPELTKELQRSGGWWAPSISYEKWETAFHTPSGKFEFFSQGIATQLHESFPQAWQLDEYLKASGVVTRGDELCLPHWEPSALAGTPDNFPFILIPYRAIDYAEGGARQFPWLQELPLGGRQAYQEHIELNPADARRIGVRDGEWAWVESQAGQRRLCVREQSGVRLGTASLPLGRGICSTAVPNVGRSAQQEISGGYGLLVNASDPLAGLFALQGTRVRIRKATTNEIA